jgi:hypothetical protein
VRHGTYAPQISRGGDVVVLCVVSSTRAGRRKPAASPQCKKNLHARSAKQLQPRVKRDYVVYRSINERQINDVASFCPLMLERKMPLYRKRYF